MQNKSFDNESTSRVVNKILDSITEPKDVLSLSLSIKASHAGKVNSNNVFYTPRGMREGATTLTQPFNKHLQILHGGKAVGVITQSRYEDYSKDSTPFLRSITDSLEKATTGPELASIARKLVSSPDYKDKQYSGLGVLQVNAELHDQPSIKELTSGANKGKVSVGGDSYKVYCSVCGGDYDEDHEHNLGHFYNGQRCFAIFDSMNLDHVGFVPDPADANTETSIIKDSISENGSEVTIKSYKIQDNKQGKSMTFTVDNLKVISKKATDIFNQDIFKGIEPKTVEAFKTKFEADSQTKLKSRFLFAEDKALPLTSKESVASVKLLVDSLDDKEPEKKALQALVQNAVDKHFKDGETVEDFVKDYKVEEPKKQEPVKEEPKKTDTVKQLDDEALNALSDTVASKVLEAIKAGKPQTVEDSVSLKQLTINNKQLSDEIEELIETNTALVEQTKSLYVEQILQLKNIEDDPEYKDSLLKRDISSLKDSLSDLRYKTKKTEVKKEPETKQEPSVKTEPEAKKEGGEEKTLAKAGIQDSINKNATKEQTPATEGKMSDAEFIRKHGIAAFRKKNKA